jgi:hypothetical protein
MTRRRLLIALAAALPLAAAGCGERPTTQVTVYKQGQYQGKPDKKPWESDAFKGDKTAWQKSLNARMITQNEYVRVAGN